MTDRDRRLADRALLVVLACGWMAAAIVLLLMACGCTSCPPCEPEVQTVRVEVPVPVLPHLEPLPPLELPHWPDPPPNDAPPSAWSDWYAAMAATARERIALLKARLNRLEAERRQLESTSEGVAD